MGHAGVLCDTIAYFDSLIFTFSDTDGEVLLNMFSPTPSLLLYQKPSSTFVPSVFGM